MIKMPEPWYCWAKAPICLQRSDPIGRDTAIRSKQGTAFVTSRKGFCDLTVKAGQNNFDIMKIRSYTIDAQDKRDMRRLYPDVDFDWKKIGQQLATKREVCRD